jgi:hypothetical protein
MTARMRPRRSQHPSISAAVSALIPEAAPQLADLHHQSSANQDLQAAPSSSVRLRGGRAAELISNWKLSHVKFVSRRPRSH